MSSLSGKFVLRVPSELHLRLKELSLARRISLNELCSRKLSELKDLEAVEETAFSDSHSLFQEIHRRFPGVVSIVLFGSVARGEQTQASDIDLLLVMSEETVLSRELYSAWDKLCSALSERFPQAMKFSPHFVHLPKTVMEAGSLWFEVALDGKIMAAEDVSVSRFLYCVREKMAQGKIQRKLSHGHPYWIKKETHEE